MIISLSYPLTNSSPLYPGTPGISISRYRSIDAGDSSNNSTITVSSHSGTHLDFPAHFCNNGTTLMDHISGIHSQFPALCIDVPIRQSREISCKDLEKQIPVDMNAVALFVRTGGWKMRQVDPHAYCSDHPWLSEKIPDFLRRHCPHLRIFGIDQISVSSPAHRETGRVCHQKFLCHTHPVLLMEDVNLENPQLCTGPFQLTLFPYLYGALDGVPVIALMERKG